MAAKKAKSKGSEWQRQMQTGLLRYGFQTYADYTRSELWQENRRRFYDSLEVEPCCSVCNATEQLDVHHVSYAMLGREPLDHLRLLCRRCHKGVHALQRSRRLELREATDIYRPQSKTKRERQLVQLEKFAAKLGMRVVPIDDDLASDA